MLQLNTREEATGSGRECVLWGLMAFLIAVAALLSPVQARAAVSEADSRQTRLLQATVALDQAFIPTQIFLQQGDQPLALEEMKMFVRHWQRFADDFSDFRPKSHWPDFVALTTGMVKRAHKALAQGDLESAAHTLNQVRVTLHHLRTRNGVDYYPDALHAYRPHLKKLITQAESADNGRYSEMQIRQLRESWARAWPRWQAIRRHVSQAAFDQQLFEFSDGRFVALKQAVAQQQSALYRLRRALNERDHQAIARMAVVLEAGYMRTFRAFGDLPI